MSLGELFDMELEWGEEKKELEINALSLFKEIKKELKEFLLRQQFEGDSTEGAFDLLDNLTKDYKKILMKLLEETPKKKTWSDHWCVFSHYFWTLKSTVSVK